MNVIDELTANLPCFAINGSNITVIDEPQQFYETLISLTRNARQKIVISTLYFGNGIREQALIDELRNALNNNHLLRVNILVDFLRGTRDGPENSSTQLLKTLANRATVHLYHTPNLRGLLKKCLPSRINEITGIQHMKLYIFDNNIILSGANLSETYFTNRQDRYVLIRNCAPLINFFEKLVDIISSFSFVLRPDGGIDTCNNDHPYESDELEFKARVNEKLNLLQKSFLRDQQSSIQPDDEHDTILYPIIQMGLFCINQEREFLTRLLSNKEIGSRLIISSGYFNLLDEYENALSSVTHDLDIIYASPKANGFHDGSGLAGYIPSIYVDISKNFWEKCRPKTNLYEYSRMDWSYHAKGIWFTLPNSPLMCTLVGSSNYGYRSTYRDLEAQLLIVTRNPELKVRLGKFTIPAIGYLSVCVHFKIWLTDQDNCEIQDFAEAVMIPGLLVGRVLLDRLGRQGTQKVASEVAAVSQRCHRRRRPCMGSNPYEFDEMVNRLGGKSVRHISSRKSSAIELERDGAWVTVYRFPPIRIGVLLARAKFIQTMGSVCFVPYMFLQYVKDSISLANFMGAIGLALSATILLLLYSRYFNRLIGVIAMTESNQFARFGYLSFWGSRRNRVVEVKDVMSLSEANTNFKDSVLKIRQYSTSAYLFLPRQKVIIEDEDRAKLLFGDISVFNLTKKTE